jgi:2-haloacid dehalogenase
VPLASPFGTDAVDWVFLDAYSTVVQEDNALLIETCHEMARGTRGRHEASEIGRWWEERFHSLCDAANGERFVTQREIVTRSLADTARHFRSEIDQAAWSEALFAYAVRPMLHHDSRAFLENVGVPVCIVSNIDEQDFRDAAEYAGLVFADIVTSETARSYKPDPAIFREALSRTGASPARVLHIGDSYRADVVGARAAGLHVAWLNRKGAPRPAEAAVAPDAEVASFLDLLEPLSE